jgi:gliding motility-associatede transport system auxiliary component
MEMRQTHSGHRAGPSILFGVGLALVYLGERVIEAGKASTAMTVLGLALALGATAWRLVAMKRARAHGRPAEQWLALLSGMALLALFFYFLNSSLSFQLTGRTLEQSSPRLSAVVSALWPALLLAGILPMLFGELSLHSMVRAPVLDLGRVKSAILSALGLSFALVFCFAISYVASERDNKLDLAYFRTAKAGEATRKLVQALDKPIRISLFFPPANDVGEEVRSYFGDLTAASKQVVVEFYDQAIHPAKARELGVSGNGTIVIQRDTLKELINIPLVMEQARSQLRKLDEEVHKRIIGVTRPNRVVYFTQGHDERSFAPGAETDQRPTVRVLKELLTDQNYQPKELGIAQGLATDVPPDAGIVLILGPRKPFLKEETDALLRYLDRKGRLLIALDPEGGDIVPELLAALSLKYVPTVLANDTAFLNRTGQRADRVAIMTASYSSHTSVSTIGRLGVRAPTAFIEAGSLKKADKGAPGIVNVDFTVHALPNTWNDLNGNFEFDSGKEARQAYELAAAVNKRNASALAVEDEARAVVLADSDVLTDFFVSRSIGCQYLFRDAVRWLGGEEQITGTINNEEDVAITHTRRQDLWWFYTSIFVVPALVLGLGVVMTRSRRAARRSPAPAQPEAAPPAQPPAAPEVTP